MSENMTNVPSAGADEDPYGPARMVAPGAQQGSPSGAASAGQPGPFAAPDPSGTPAVPVVPGAQAAPSFSGVARVAPAGTPAASPSVASPWSAAGQPAQNPSAPSVPSPDTGAGWQQSLPLPPSYGAPGGASYPNQGPYPTTSSYPSPWPSPQPGPMRRFVLAGVAALAIAFVAGGIGGFVGYSLHGDGSSLQNLTSGSQNPAPVVDRSSLSKIAADVQPTVVVIETNSGEGSGVILTNDGYILTNNHVVSGARGSTVRVIFNSGKQVQGTIVGTDPRTDLAVVKAGGASGLKFATFGDSDAVQVGDTVLAIGSPLGLQGSVTAGIVSALHRTITVGDNQQSPFEAGVAPTTIGDAIQTDAPINPGNSGGALVDMAGHVIGINSAIATSGSTGNIGVGFAISANKAKSVADQIIKGGHVSHPYLGVSVQNAESGGAQVEQVQPGSPAAKAGLQVGDVITKINDRPISGREDLVGAIQSGSVGTAMKLTITRAGTDVTVTVTLTEAP
jgi:putative serine protease PepD